MIYKHSNMICAALSENEKNTSLSGHFSRENGDEPSNVGVIYIDIK